MATYEEGEEGEGRDGPVLFPLAHLPPPEDQDGEDLDDGGSIEPPAYSQPVRLPYYGFDFEQKLGMGSLSFMARAGLKSAGGSTAPVELLVLVVGCSAVVGLAVALMSVGMVWAGVAALGAIIGWVTWLLVRRKPDAG